MKIVCIKQFKSQGLQYELTKGKVYETIDDVSWLSDNAYYLMNDRLFKSAYNKSSFITLEEYRQNKLKELGV